MKVEQVTGGYALLDSGGGQKVEQLGDCIVCRPSSWCVWRPRGGVNVDVTFEPQSAGVKGEGWSSERPPWVVHFPQLGVAMEARLQRNGQIGIFPEHASYLPRIAKLLTAKPGAKVLNLFAFTGLASMVTLKNGASVTHVDILKPVLDWAARNADLNAELDSVQNGDFRSRLRLIPEEALVFLGREVRRGNQYDLIILDPPSFSRIGKGKDWELDTVLRELLSACLTILSPTGSLYFTCHHGELAGAIVENLLRELEQERPTVALHSELLHLVESSRPRSIPAGFLTVLQR